MKRVLFAILLTIIMAVPASALVVAGVPIEPAITVNERPLHLNGYGIRTKWWVKVYIGSLYTSKPMNTFHDLTADPYDKLIRLNFLHSKVDKEKITDAIRDGFVNTRMGKSVVAKEFLALFTRDFVRGDSVDIVLGGEGTVVYKHNNQVMGTIVSKQLAKGILGIYFGPVPADEDLKTGMLGR